jgi:protein TonB
MNPAVPIITAADRLGLTIFLAGSVHALVILGVAFQPEDLAKLKPPASLEIILVQQRSQERPDAADYLAQVSQAGGGESELRERPGSPFTSPELTDSPGIAPQPMQGGNPEQIVNYEQAVVTQLYSDHQTAMLEQEIPSEQTHPTRDAEVDFDLEIARLSAELKQARDTYAKRPKKVVLTASTHEYLPAHYMYDWVEKVERIGNLNYPDKALRQKLEGTLMLAAWWK